LADPKRLTPFNLNYFDLRFYLTQSDPRLRSLLLGDSKFPTSSNGFLKLGTEERLRVHQRLDRFSSTWDLRLFQQTRVNSARDLLAASLSLFRT